MASSSSFTSPPLYLPRKLKHHVFPSFHGADVRRSLLSHILKEFESKAIDLFIDNNIKRGKSIAPELIEAIRGSRIAIVLLSKNYASSTWCLNELVEIIKCREVLGQTVMVLFYEVDPSDVKKQTGEFGKAFRKSCKGKTEDHIGRWKQALAEVAQIAGYHSKNWDNDATMIEEIAVDVSHKLNNSTPSSDFDILVGMESHMRKMGPLLRLDLEEVRMIGILGLPGIGKTTIARFLFHRYSKDFQLSVFMENIGKTYPIAACSDVYPVQLNIQGQFLSQLFNQVGIKVSNLGIAKDRLKDKKVLVVLDNVDQLIQVQSMAETGWFGPRSRIIITTQDEKLLRQSGVIHIYKVDLPSSDEALQIFCMYAFGQKSPEDGFTELASDVTRLVGKLPLGLRVMGSYFKGLSKQRWSMELPRLSTCLDGEIESILKFSYEALNVAEKYLFLHIACFFSDERIDVVEGCLKRSFQNVTLSLHILAEKSLISLDDEIVKMHSLLIQLGRETVRNQHFNDLSKRQFLEDISDVDEVLNDDEPGSSSVIGIDLKFKNKDITFTNERASRRLYNLQFLRNDGDDTNFYFPGKLRYLRWKQFSMPCFPPSFHPKFLVKLDMPYSNLEKLWEENQMLTNLKWMDLSYSKSLKELPCMSSATNLCELRLSDCSSLVELPHSIGDAINLQKLDLSYCESLVEIPSSIGNVIGLQELDLSYCSSLVKLPSSIGNAVNLQKLNLTHCSSLLEVPFSIENAINLQKMDLNGCSSMVELPFYIERVTDSKYLNFSGCSSLVKLPSSIGNAINLEELNLSFCSSLVEIPSSIGNAINLRKMDLSYCLSLVDLPSSMRNLRRLSILDLKRCSNLEVLLSNIHLESLEQINLSGTAIHELPSSLRLWPLKLDISYSERQELGPLNRRVSGLHRLVLNGMQKLRSLPQLPDSLLELDAENCVSLEKLDCSFRNPDIRLNFGKCFKLNQEARDLIIQTPTSKYTVLPSEEVPIYFNFRGFGSALIVKLNQKPFGTSRFRACILLGDKENYDLGHWGQAYVSWSITTGQNAPSSCGSSGKILESVFPDHLYTFEVEAMAVTCTELFFEFQLRSLHFNEIWEIKECGILQISRENISYRETKMMASSSSPLSLPETKTMASSPSPLSLPSSLPRNWKHDVFPSFRGEDIGRTFFSHILKEFRIGAINVFIDNDLKRGESIAPELKEVIRGSRIALVFLSKNYASSKWCLDELVEIIKCGEVLRQTVMVIFYEVDPTDVRKQTGEFGKVFRRFCKGKTKDDIERWKQALAEVAKMAGYHSSNWDDEAEMIDTIATDVSNKLNFSTSSTDDFDGFVGMRSHIFNMGQLLRPDLEEMRVIGIWGPSGIGKTTIARVLFSLHSQNFQLSVFMENIKTSYAMPTCSDDYSVKKYLQEQFMSKIINHKGLKIPHLGIVKDRLKDKKVLVVLDDVDRPIQVEAIMKETSWFGPGSRIIITTQDRKLLQTVGVNHTYKVDFPSSSEALEMFCMYAFGQKSPNDGFQELAWQVTRLVGGLPLGLKIVGSHFRGMSKQDWTESLPSLKTRLDGEIESILKFSYDSLGDEDKNLFLHLTCFFNGEFVSKLEDYLANSFAAVTLGLHVLVEKSLVSQSFGMIKMNNLLVQLGREIVRRASVDMPERRQFLFDARDIDEVLRDDTTDGSSLIGIDLKCSYENEDITCISERAFKRLSNLQFLRIDGDGMHFYFPRSLESISRKLRFLSWTQFPMPCFPSNFSSEFLVNLEMPKSKLQKLWEGIQPLSNLKWMDLSFSESLEKLPDLSTAVNLQTLNLSHCSNLVELPSSIGNAISLEDLDLSHCLSLVGLPSSMKNLCGLSKLDLKNCSKLEVLLTDINLESLKELDLSDCALLKSYPEALTNIGDLIPNGIQELGPWIGKISCLRRLVLNGIQKLVSLPQLPYSLEHLDAEYCESLEILDCSFRNPEIRLNFAKCIKLNQEARDVIIQTRTNEYAVFPSGEVPVCFTFRASGSSLTVKLNQNPLSTSKKFRVCIILAKKAEYVSGDGREVYVYCSITSEQKAFTSNSKSLKPVFPEHLYTFEVEAVNLTSTEVVFKFQLLAPNWEIKKCGIIQLMEVPDMHRGRKEELIDDLRRRMRVVVQ